MPGKSIEQRISDTETRIRQLEVQRRLLAGHLKAQERKERTRRLIQIGGIMARLGIDSVAKAQALQCEVEAHPQMRVWLEKLAVRSDSESQAPADSV